ncbi:MAG TPA: hypothetical protein VEO73_13980 [Gemmatimonadales bacterium]|nr:hypothetical protein [Gemmatimonadales bacterium]
MTRVWVTVLALAVSAPAAQAQQPDSAGLEDPDVPALRQQIRQRWHEHVRQILGLSDDQATKVQSTEDRFEQLRVLHRGQIRDINRQLNEELRGGNPNNGRVNQLIQQRQETRMMLEQLNRDEDKEMAGYLSPPQRVRYQQERVRLQERIAEFVRHRREQAVGGGRSGPSAPRRGAGGDQGRRPAGGPARKPRP